MNTTIKPLPFDCEDDLRVAARVILNQLDAEKINKCSPVLKKAMGSYFTVQNFQPMIGEQGHVIHIQDGIVFTVNDAHNLCILRPCNECDMIYEYEILSTQDLAKAIVHGIYCGCRDAVFMGEEEIV